MLKYLVIPVVAGFVFLAWGIASKLFPLVSIGWLFMMVAIFFSPKAGEELGWIDSERIANTYYATGLLMVTAGALGAAFVVSQLTLQGADQAIAKFVALAVSALPGGALCADAILGLEIEAKQRKISAKYALIAAVVFALVIAFCTFFLKREGDFEYWKFLVQTTVAGLLSSLGPVLGAWASSKSEDAGGASTSRTSDLLALSGVLGIGASVVSLYVAKIAMSMLGWGPAAETFVDEILPAFGAAVSACLLVRALEINRLPFDDDLWFRGIGVALTEKAGFDIVWDGKGHAQIKLLANDRNGFKADIEVSMSDPVRQRLIHGNGFVRRAVAQLAIGYLKRQLKESPEAKRFSLKEDLLLSLH